MYFVASIKVIHYLCTAFSTKTTITMVQTSKTEIRTTLALIELRLQLPSMREPANAALKEGYMEAKRVLEQEDEDLSHIAANCESVQARCIAWQAVDYLQGEISREQLLQYQPKITAGQ